MKQLRNENGVTLAELLAALAIGSLIAIFVMSIHVLVQKQYSSQKADAQQLTDITIAVKEITRDVRMYEIGSVVTNEKIEFIDGNKYEYDAENNVLQKNDVNYIYEIKRFKIERNGDKILLEIESTAAQKINTEIIIR